MGTNIIQYILCALRNTTCTCYHHFYFWKLDTLQGIQQLVEGETAVGLGQFIKLVLQTIATQGVIGTHHASPPTEGADADALVVDQILIVTEGDMLLHESL